MFWGNKETIDNGYGVSVTISPSRSAIAKSVKAAEKDLKNQRGPYKKASLLLDQWVQQNFKTEGGKVGGWKSFDRMNRRWLADPSAKLLQDTGRLRSTFRPFASTRNAGIGSFLKYSKPHDQGTRHIPQRRILPEKYREVKPIVETVWNKHIKDSFRQ